MTHPSPSTTPHRSGAPAGTAPGCSDTGWWQRACCSQAWHWGGGKGGGKGNKVTGKKTERKVGWAEKGEKGKCGRQSKPEGWDAQVERQ